MSENQNAMKYRKLLPILRHLPILIFALFAVLLYPLYGLSAMKLMGEDAGNVYDLAKIDEGFANGLLIAAALCLACAAIGLWLSFSIKTADKRFSQVWMHEIVSVGAVVLYIIVMVLSIKGKSTIEDLWMDAGIGLILPMVLSIVFALATVASVIVWRVLHGIEIERACAQEYVDGFVAPEKPETVEKPLNRMSAKIQKLTKLHKKKAVSNVWIWVYCFLMISVVVLFMQIVNDSDSILRALHLWDKDHNPSTREKVSLSTEGVKLWQFFVLGYALYCIILMLLVLLANCIGSNRKKKFEKSRAGFIFGQMLFVGVVLATAVIIFMTCQKTMDKYYETLPDGRKRPTIFYMESTMEVNTSGMWLSIFVVLFVFLIVEWIHLRIQSKMKAIKREEGFHEDVIFYEENFLSFKQEYKVYRKAMREYNRKTYRYRRAQEILA